MPPRLPRAALTSLIALLLGVAFPSLIGSARAPAAAASSLPRITFAAAQGSSILVHGTYPKTTSICVNPVQPLLHARYTGTIEVGKDTDGSLFVIGELPFEDYLKGIAEVPRTWPMAALEAQVVAARTYALSRLDSPDEIGTRLGYQLCVTDHCQVYRGMGISAGPYGARWRKAVDQTAAEALLYQGEPADTLYFSTSNGTTHGNAEIFEGSPLPYLQAVPEHDDGASGLSHWHTSIPFADIGSFLSANDEWPGGTKVTGVKRSGDTITVTGKKTTRKLDVVDFRTALNTWAHCLDPNTYPTVDGSSRLPQTLPSRWFSLHTENQRASFDGRGWGHGVGMVQWGAYGKARRGMTYDDILAAYYGGLRPQTYPEPATIRVGIATGLKTVKVEASGDVTVTGRTLRQGGPWLLTGGKLLRIHHSNQPPTYIAAGTIKGPGRARMGQERHATITVPQLSVVHLVLTSDGHDVELTKPNTYEAGTVRIPWIGPEATTGRYQLEAVVTDGTDIVRTKGVPLRFTGLPVVTPSPSPSPIETPAPSTTPPAPSPSPPPTDKGKGLAVFVLVASAIAAVLLGTGSFLYLYRKTEGRRGPVPPWERYPGGPEA